MISIARRPRSRRRSGSDTRTSGFRSALRNSGAAPTKGSTINTPIPIRAQCHQPSPQKATPSAIATTWRSPPAESIAGPREGRFPASEASGPCRHLHYVEPLAIALHAAVQGVLEHLLHRARDLAGAAVPDVDVVDRAHRRQLRRGAREEHLVGERQLRPGHVALEHL